MKETNSGAFTRCDFSLDILDMLQTSTALVGVYDSNEVLRYSNEAFRKAYAIAPDEQVDWQTLMRRNFASSRGTVIETADIEGWISSVRSRRGKSPKRTYESDLHDGRYIWVTETMREDGWIIYVGTDVTELHVSARTLRQDRDRLFRQSFTDDLTGVSNRRHILSKLQESLDSGQEGWACVLDLDHFKKINDTHGHQVGDEVLVNFAQTVRKIIKLKDAFGRIGGEEFLILFARQTLADVKSTLLHLQESLTPLSAKSDLPELKVTISGGLTDVAQNDTQAQILRRADQGLYCAKERGRNQIRLLTADMHLANPSLLTNATNLSSVS